MPHKNSSSITDVRRLNKVNLTQWYSRTSYLIVAVHSDHITALKCPRCKDKEVKGERLDSFLWRLVRYPQRMPAVKSSYLMLVHVS